MRILQLTRDYARNGGLGSYVQDLTALLHDAGHRVQVVCSHGEAGTADVVVDRVPGFDEFEHHQARATRSKIRAIADEFDPDLVLVHSLDDYDLEASLRDRHRVVRFIHNHQYCSSGIDHATASLEACTQPQGIACISGFVARRCWRTRNPAVAARQYRQARAAMANLRSSTLLFVGSGYVRERVIRNGVDPDRVTVVPYFTGVPGLADTQPTVRQDGGTLLFVGRLYPEKGLAILLRSLSELVGAWRLVVNGDGPALGSAIELARRLKLLDRIVFEGWTSRERLLEDYAAADIVVVPSVWPEPFGLVGIEAMSYGKPVVAFRGGGIPEWLSHGETGFLVQNGDVVELRQRIAELLADPGLRLRMGKAGHDKVVADFSPARHLEAIMTRLNAAAQLEPRPGSGHG